MTFKHNTQNNVSIIISGHRCRSCSQLSVAVHRHHQQQQRQFDAFCHACTAHARLSLTVKTHNKCGRLKRNTINPSNSSKSRSNANNANNTIINSALAVRRSEEPVSVQLPSVPGSRRVKHVENLSHDFMPSLHRHSHH